MKFLIIYRDYSDYGDDIYPERQPNIGGLEIKQIDCKQERYPKWVKHTPSPQAIMKDGEPTVMWEDRQDLMPPKEFSSWKQFCEIGRNHQDNDKNWSREIEIITWWLEVEDLEDFMWYCTEYALTYEGNNILYWS